MMDLLLATKEILACEKDGSFQPYIPYGKLGYGKTTWAGDVALELRYYQLLDKALKMLSRKRWKTANEPYEVMQALNEKGHKEFPTKEEVLDYVKQTLFFKPLNMLDRLDWLDNHDVKALVMIADDAGAHLSSMEWYEPYIKAMGEYMDLARTQLTSMIFTSPQPSRIAKKIRTIPGTTIVRIVKRVGSDNKSYKRWWRTALYKRYWYSPGFNKEGYGGKDYDYFNCKMPDFIYEWYQPLRKKRVAELRQNVKTKVKKIMFKEREEREKLSS